VVGSYPGDNRLHTNVAWWENPGNGAGNRARHHVGAILYRDADWFAIGELNGDGRSDIIVTEEISVRPYRPAHLFWFQQPTNPKSPGWIRHTVMEGYTLKSLDVVDMDKDGDLDVVTCEQRGTRKLMI